jgi:ribose transport system substrate-binding protein
MDTQSDSQDNPLVDSPRSPADRKKILLVDDDPLILHILSNILSDNQYKVETAESGKQALTIIDDSFHLLLSDFEMPEMNGLELIEAVRKSDNDIPIIILTGNQEISVALNALKLGANEYVIKDENITETVLTALSNALERKMLLDQNTRLINNLMKAKNDAERANNAKSDFLAKMSHDLKTPLNAILGFAQLTIKESDEPLGEDAMYNLQQINKAGHHLLELINDILDLSAIEAGKLKVVIEKIDLISVIQESLVLIRPAADKHDIEIIDETKDHESLLVLADSLRLKQVLLNLLSNGIKYNSLKGSLTLSLTTEGNQVRLNVRDTGLGIPEEKMKTLFEKFNRLGAENTNIEGTGIGLNICLNLIQLMNGRLKVESEVGKGSCFSITLPMSLKRPDKSKDLAAASKEHLNILYINSQEEGVEIFKNITRSRPFIKLFLAETDEEGLEMASSKNPKLILLDFNSEDHPSLEIYQKLKDKPETANIPFVALVNKDQLDELASTLDDFFDYLTYPINAIQLLATIESALEI